MAFRSTEIVRRSRLVADRIVRFLASVFVLLPGCVLASPAVTIRLAGPNPIGWLDRAHMIPPSLVLGATCGICLIVAGWWIREHRIAAQQNAVLSLNALAEEIVTATSPLDIQRRLTEVMKVVPAVTEVRLYLYNRKTRRLECLGCPEDREAISIDAESPARGLATGVALAFRTRTLLNIPNTRRSSILKPGDGFIGPRSVLWAPMLAQSELVGVLEAGHADGIHRFSNWERMALQHLANQAAIALQLQERQSRREQALRGEKHAATGELISSVSSELQSPLENILLVATQLAAQYDHPAVQREIRVLTEEAQRASEVVARLASFNRGEAVQPNTVEMNGLISSLIQLREREWEALGIEVHRRLARVPLYTNGPSSQLEQVFLNVLMHAEQCAAGSPERLMSIATRAVGQFAVVDLSYSCPPGHDSRSGSGMGIWRTIVHGHGGETRFSQSSPSMCRLEIDLRLSGEVRTLGASGARHSSRPLTTLVIEPDASARRYLVQELSAREHRAVPVTSAEEALDLAQRLRFDVVFCAATLQGSNWRELYERVHPLITAFVLMVDELDPHPTEVLFLKKACSEAELDRVLTEVDAPLAGRAASQLV
jgi:GAF domain-containing protein